MLSFTVFAIVVHLICISSAIDDLPSNFPKCNIDSPDLNACILKASYTLREQIKKGVPELEIPPTDPLVVPSIELQQGTNAVNYKIKLINAKVIGLGGYMFKEFTYDPKTYTFAGTADFKDLAVESEFEIEGKILVAPINGKGSLKINVDTATGIVSIKGELVNRKGDDYYRTKDVKAQVILGKSKASFKGSFGDNEQISRATSNLLEEHSDEIIKDFVPAVEKIMEAVFLRMMNAITKIPYKKLFPTSQ